MERVHVAAFPSTGSGHINPMLELCRHLVPLGFTVSVLLTQNDYAKMQSTDEHIHFVSIPNPPKHLMVCPEMQEPVETILRGLSSPVDCIISDFFLGWSQDLADRLGVPRIALVTCSAIGEALCYHLPLLISRGRIPVKDDDSSLITFLPGFESIHPRQIPLSFRVENEFAPVLGQELQRMKEALCVLVNTVEELENHVVKGHRSELTNYLPVGPLIPSAAALSDDNCISWLDKHAPRSVLYIAFGSGYSLPVDKVEMIAKAVKTSGQPVLWAMRRNFPKDAPETFYESIASMFDELVMVVEWAPQMQVLKHPSVCAFFTHCGWNSTLEALCSGVPTLCWPCGAEQNLNAQSMVESWGIGLEVAEGNDKSVTEQVIVEKIKIVMESDAGAEMRNRAQGLKNVVHGSQKGGSSEKNLQTFREIILSAKH